VGTAGVVGTADVVGAVVGLCCAVAAIDPLNPANIKIAKQVFFMLLYFIFLTFVAG
jgi:hypothetical protein